MDGDAPDWLRPRGRGWQINSRTHVHDNPWFAVDAFDATAPTGAPAKYYLQQFKNTAVGVVPLHDDGTITLVGQWRFPFNTYSWELPEGGAPKGEDPIEGAKRELREEAGLEAANWRHLLTMQLSNSCSDEVAHGYLATGLSPIADDPDATEELAIARAPFGEVLKAIASGRIQDAITVAMLLRVYHMAQQGELPDSLTAAVLG